MAAQSVLREYWESVSMVGNEFNTAGMAPMSSFSWIITVESAFFFFFSPPPPAEERRMWCAGRSGLNQKTGEKNEEKEADDPEWEVKIKHDCSVWFYQSARPTLPPSPRPRPSFMTLTVYSDGRVWTTAVWSGILWSRHHDLIWCWRWTFFIGCSHGYQWKRRATRCNKLSLQKHWSPGLKSLKLWDRMIKIFSFVVKHTNSLRTFFVFCDLLVKKNHRNTTLMFSVAGCVISVQVKLLRK